MKYIKNIDKEIAEYDYYLKLSNVEEKIDAELIELPNRFSKGHWITNVSINDDYALDLICLDSTGLYIFYKAMGEITDQSLWELIKRVYNATSLYFEELGVKDINFYTLLIGPITQKDYYAVFNPDADFLRPINNLSDSFLTTVKSNAPVLLSDEIDNIFNYLTKESEEDKKVDKIEHIRVLGKEKIKSDIDSEKYFKFLLYGGIIGLHKAYVNNYLAFFAYLISLGFFGFAWVYDLIEVAFGICKDKTKKYIGPFENIKRKRILISIICVVYFIMLISFFGFF